MNKRFTFTITINGTLYDLSPIADSSTFQLVSPLCSNKKKSANGTANVVLKGGANTTFYRSLMMPLLTAQQTKVLGDCLITIKDNSENKFIHRGYLNLDAFEISSTSFPDALTLSSKDRMQLLDTKIKYNQYWEYESRNQIVQDLLDYLESQTGLTLSYLSSELSDDETVDKFCIAEGKNETYRDVIDRLLFEAVGYVLWYDPNSDGFRIKKIPTDIDPEATYRVITYRLENKLTTQSAVYENDGVLLSYPTITERPNTNIYNDDISLDIDGGGEVVGTQVQSGDYYPEDGDVKEIYQEYSVPDRAYISHESRLENEDLELLYAKDVTYELASNPTLSLAPAIPNVHWDGTPKYYPDRARILFVNNNVNPSNVTTFSITGTAVYISAMNKITVPSACTNPEEYTVKTITDSAKAKAFADWYYNSQRYGCTTSRWSEPEGYSVLGEIVMVRHKDTGIEMPHVIVQITDTNAGGASGTIRLKNIIALSLYGWQEVLVGTTPTIRKPSINKPQGARWYNGTILQGTSTARGVAGNYGDFYLNTDTGDIYKCINSGDSYSALWQWIMNNKGDDASVVGMKYEVEYGLSTSDSEFIFPSTAYGYDNTGNEAGLGALDAIDDEEINFGFEDYAWSPTTDGWYRGLYVWQRIKITDVNGNIEYQEPTYDETMTDSLLQSCRIDLLTEPKTFVVNPRDITYQYIPVKLLFIGYRGLATLLTDNGIFCKYNPLTQDYDEYSNYLVNLVVTNPTAFLDYVVKLPFTLAENTEVKITTTLTEWDGTERSAETVISATKAKTAVVQLATVPTVEDLPTHLNLTDPLQADILTGNNLIYGDYIIVEYFQIAPDEHGNYPEPYDPSKVYYIRTVVSDEVVMQIATISGDFDGTTTYYRYAPNPWMYDGSIWVSEQFVKPYVKVNTVDEVVSLARIKYQTDPSIDYHECLYAYEGYISNLTVGILNVGDIFANNIESTNYQEDADDVPIQGYKLAYQGGENGAGEIRSAGGVYKDMNVRGALRMWKDNKETVGADIEHPALTTVSETMGSDPTGVTVNTSPVAWLSDAFLSLVSSLTADQVKSASGSFKNKSMEYYVRATNLNTVLMSGMTVAQTAVVYSRDIERLDSPTITVPQYYKGTVSFIVSGTQSRIKDYGGGNYHYNTSAVYMVKNGVPTKIKEERGSVNGYGDYSYSYEVNLTGGDSVYFYIAGLGEHRWTIEEIVGGTINFTVNSIYLYNMVSTTGFWLFYTDGTNERIDSGLSYFDRMQMSSPVSFDSNNYLTLRDCSVFINYRTFVDSQGVSRTLQDGRTYDITSSNLYVNGGASTGLWLTRNLNSVVLGYRYNSVNYQIILNSGQYYDITGTIKIAETNTIGVKMMGNYPKYDADDPRGGYDCGNSAYSWNNGYFKTIHYQNVGGGSARALKENISPFTKNALEIIKKTDIVNFNYKKDKDKTKKIGFIADDTPEELSGKEHDRMELDHCVAVLIKAVQELSEEIKNLKEKNITREENGDVE